MVRGLAGRILIGAGYRVLVAATAARRCPGGAARAAIHLLLTDVVMPGMSGRELGAAIAGDAARPVLFMSGYTTTRSRSTASSSRGRPSWRSPSRPSRWSR